jgi:predicted nucleic acid-binding protein
MILSFGMIDARILIEHERGRLDLVQHLAQRSAFVETILERFPLLPVDLAAAGKMIEPHDLWLPATCLAQGHTMITANL